MRSKSYFSKLYCSIIDLLFPLNCPFCNKLLEFDNYYNKYVCPTQVKMNSQLTKSHYEYCVRPRMYDMSVFPYTVLTFIDKNYSVDEYYSIVFKYSNNICVTIIDTSELNVEPIYPRPEAELKRRIETILVFS